MRSTARATLFALAALGLGAAADAKPLSYVLPEESAALRPGSGPGFEATRNSCSACHSADYVNTQPPKLGAAFWTAEVQKMINVYHAPIEPADIKSIAEYLAATY